MPLANQPITRGLSIKTMQNIYQRCALIYPLFGLLALTASGQQPADNRQSKEMLADIATLFP